MDFDYLSFNPFGKKQGKPQAEGDCREIVKQAFFDLEEKFRTHEFREDEIIEEVQKRSSASEDNIRQALRDLEADKFIQKYPASDLYTRTAWRPYSPADERTIGYH